MARKESKTSRVEQVQPFVVIGVIGINLRQIERFLKDAEGTKRINNRTITSCNDKIRYWPITQEDDLRGMRFDSILFLNGWSSNERMLDFVRQHSLRHIISR